MDLRPWNYWTRDGEPYAETSEIQAVLQQILAKHPKHPGALHYWIHLWEPTDTPERAEAEADRLLPLMPGAGHVVHMPAHIYMRVGRHADVVSSNQMAVKADEDYIAQCRAQGMYPLGYYPHNIHFIWMGATASGQGKVALDAARKVADAIPAEALGTVPILQGFLVVPYWAMVRFARWDDIMNDKGPRHDTAFTKGVWRFARAMALTATDRLSEAEQELAELNKVVERSVAQGSDDVFHQQRPRDPADCAGSRGRRNCREAQGLGHRGEAPRSRDSLRGRPRLSGATRLAGAGAAEPRRRACSRRAEPTRPRRCTGKICGRIRETAGRSSG